MPATARLEGLNRSLLYPGQRVCCALSGGADSTALLLALLEANGEKESLGLVLSAVHVHHGLRGAEADADQAFVQNLCDTHQVPLTVIAVDTAARQLAEREGLEEAARELRYTAFRELLASHKADCVATAHTLDDQAETVLMKLVRGAWTEGLAGIAPVLPLTSDATQSPTRQLATRNIGLPSQAVLRPMLQTSRAEIERFLRERDQPWRDDSSNTDTSLTRNRVRHDLLPLLRTFNPSIAGTLGRTAEIARAEEEYLQSEAARLLPSLSLPGKPVRGGGRAVSTGAGERSLALEIERLKAQPEALRRRLIRAAALTLGCRPGSEETQKLLALAGLGDFPGVSTRNGARLELGQGLRAERSLRELRPSRSEGPSIPKKV